MLAPSPIVVACELLDGGRIDEAAALVAGLEQAASAVQSIALVASGLICEREGRGAEALERVERAQRLGVPLPAVLRACGRFFQRAGRHRRAARCYGVLAAFDPTAVDELAAELPARELARWSPWLLDPARRGGPWVIHPVKRALVGRHGTAAAAAAFAYANGSARDSELVTLPVAGLRDVARTYGLAYEELVPARAVHLPDPPVFGRRPGPGFDARTRTLFFTRLADAVVSSKSSFLVCDGRAVLDVQDDELARVALDFSLDAPVLTAGDGSVTMLLDGHARRGAPLDRAISLVGMNTTNFGHWLLEFLPVVLMARRRPDAAAVPFVVDAQMPSQLRQSLRLFAGDDHPVVELPRGHAVRVRELWAFARPMYVPLAQQAGAVAARELMVVDPDAFAGLLETARPQLERLDGARGPRRLFLTREDHQHRRIVNRVEVEAWFREHGFHVVDFGRLPFAEQLRLTRGAEVVVGPDGSSLLVSLFGRPGLRVGVLDNPHLADNEWYVAMCRRLGQPVSYLVGEAVRDAPDYWYHADYRIDVAHLPGVVDDLLRR